MDTRRCLDRLADILISLNRETSRLRVNARGARAAMALAGTSNQAQEFRDELRQAEDSLDEVKYLFAAAKLRRENLKQAASDIRVIVSVIMDQRRLGDVEPPADRQEPPAEREPEPAQIEDFREDLPLLQEEPASRAVPELDVVADERIEDIERFFASADPLPGSRLSIEHGGTRDVPVEAVIERETDLDAVLRTLHD